MKTWSATLCAALVAAVVVCAGALLALRAALAPLPGEWSMPLRLGPVEVEAGVPSLIRLATSPWGGSALQGRSFTTSSGVVQLGWNAQERSLQVHCAPCTLRLPGLGPEPLRLAQLSATVHRQGELLEGQLWSNNVRAVWRGELSRGSLHLRFALPTTPLADAYALFAAQVPEVRRARIEGTVSLQAQLSLPAGTLTLAPRIEGFEVAGLGTEALAHARSACGRRQARLTAESWLSRAVIAAEDQRFFDHPGYDLAELNASLARNGQAQHIARGGSTLSQQTAKLLITGDQRSAARKLRELLFAVEMERTLGKPRILRLYLDNAPWGMAGLCGAEAAALRYFGVRAHELGPAQAAWLAAMLHNPVLEAQRWATTGGIDLARAQRIALGMRGMSQKDRRRLADEMAAMPWQPTWMDQ